MVSVESLEPCLQDFFKDKRTFYTGNADFFLTQLLGSVVVVVFVLVIMGLAFTLIKHTSGLRVSAAEEIEGLDNREHGLNSAYGDLLPTVILKFFRAVRLRYQSMKTCTYNS